jgi:hypothetical protein
MIIKAKSAASTCPPMIAEVSLSACEQGTDRMRPVRGWAAARLLHLGGHLAKLGAVLGFGHARHRGRIGIAMGNEFATDVVTGPEHLRCMSTISITLIFLSSLVFRP